ncbi:MAG: hypothetical protein GF383_07750 [Candidatus Lokiarchaeota archaeon]|nr:hypothetical protein [Candidatus Lokiarchaeota archaeon]MBD3340165.1 hypothetical protein [Candidatus Lokiarchaeota archaeon]
MEETNNNFVKRKIKEHWAAIIASIIVGICAVVGMVLVLVWLVETSDIGLQGTATFDQWSLAWVVIFILLLILWELLFVGLPVGLFFGVGGYLWWRRLPDEEKQEFRTREKESKKHRGKHFGGCNFVFFVAYCIYIAIEGNFFRSFGSLPYSYWLYACIWTVIWIIIIFGIPGAIIGIIYFKKWLNETDD